MRDDANASVNMVGHRHTAVSCVASQCPHLASGRFEIEMDWQSLHRLPVCTDVNCESCIYSATVSYFVPWQIQLVNTFTAVSYGSTVRLPR